MKTTGTRIAAIILVLFLASFSEASWTFVKMNVSWMNVIASGNLGMLFRQARTPRAGEFVLPPVAQSSISLLRANRITGYRFSPAFEQNTEIRDRLIEGAYPLHHEVHSHYLLFLVQESPEQKCSQVSRLGGVALVYCP